MDLDGKRIEIDSNLVSLQPDLEQSKGRSYCQVRCGVALPELLVQRSNPGHECWCQAKAGWSIALSELGRDSEMNAARGR